MMLYPVVIITIGTEHVSFVDSPMPQNTERTQTNPPACTVYSIGTFAPRTTGCRANW